MDTAEIFKNKHNGERAFFIGNGPSLSNTPLTELESEHTFATNRIWKYYDDTSWRPDYYTYIHRHGLVDKEAITNSTSDETIGFVSSHAKEQLQEDENIIYLNSEQYKDDRVECLRKPETIPDYAYDLWSDDLQEVIYGYNGSIYAIFQLVHYMGFDELYLVGCDLGIDTDWYPIYEEALEPKEFIFDYEGQDRNTKVGFIRRADEKMKSVVNVLAYKYPTPFEIFYQNEHHFTSDYFGNSIKRGTDGAQRRAHRLGRIKLQERGVDVYNATIGGELEVHPRVALSEITQGTE